MHFRLLQFGFILVALVLSGCSFNYVSSVTDQTLKTLALKENFTIERRGKWQINREAKILVVSTTQVPAKEYGVTSQYRRANTQLFASLNRSFSQGFPNFVAKDSKHSMNQALNLAWQNRADILIYPLLIDLKNGINTWSEMQEGDVPHSDKYFGPDVSQFQLFVLDVKTRKLLDVIHVKGRGRFFAESNSLPIDLLDKATQQVAVTLFGVRTG
ncbi:DUF4823 domain-containing protein [Teredinibacter sp. KSP-S5-2]|uniref:DUF4823 domain-containing protein n=1 Tax=Teredinibacter sp. KSP-S5-2 TaxID=3034506 RepID=UPI002934D272|nr:DUF4823 domain-containing protein [Teredinibacter sp. KSP-S5-2]WNO11395.1 DUF4823 domain-containing protein [Teredinibacter sp. KSP-S5-2]